MSKWVAPSDKRFVYASCQTVIARDHSAAHLSRDRYFPKVTRCDGRPSQPAKNLLDLARRENLTVRQLYGHVCNGAGHHAAVGTPGQMPPYLPGGLEDFVDLVVPELQHRGLFGTKYEGTTLRDHLGLARPVLVKELVRASQ